MGSKGSFAFVRSIRPLRWERWKSDLVLGVKPFYRLAHKEEAAYDPAGQIGWALELRVHPL